MNARKDVYQLITDRISEKLEAGAIPWHKPWTSVGAPMSLATKQPYRGVNVFLLASMGYESPYWITWNQLKKLDGCVRKGEKACPVVFWKWREKKTKEMDEHGNPVVERRSILRYYQVFNAQQCTGIEDKVPEFTAVTYDHDPIDAAEAVVSAMPQPPTMEIGRARAAYCPTTDTVSIPSLKRFESAEAYHATLFHELVHSTGASMRLARKGITETTNFGSETYSREELVAEMGAAFLGGHVGIEPYTIDNSAAYIQGWLRRLKSDKRLVVTAAAQAQKAADYVLGVSPTR